MRNMIRRNRANKIYLILLSLASVALIVFFIIKALEKNIDLYLTPTQIFSGEYNTVQKFKLGGMVEKGSLQRVEGEDLVVTFTVTDFENSIDVVYVGVLPNLFKENSGVVASGYLTEGNSFWAVEILAKHDENYMPVKLESYD
tara:strand:+ start:10765 stop:11193 length:429 start_codon:yes stop_codon:yes gene_type:complete